MEISKNIVDVKRFANKYFDFLITDYGFENIPEYNVSYEFHFGYRKSNIEINFACEADGDSLPWVTLNDYGNTFKIGEKEYPKSYHLTQIEVPGLMKEVFVNRNERHNPKVQRFVDAFVSKKVDYAKAHKELEQDYEDIGRNELNTVVKEYAEIIKRHPQILSGDLSAFQNKSQELRDSYDRF